MPRLVWLTDLHLNFVTAETLEELAGTVRSENPDVVLISGDTGEAPSFSDYLRDLQVRLNVPIYFVLGNHDFYHGSIAAVREAARKLACEGSGLSYLSQSEVIRISDATSLVGHDGWGDGRFGNFMASNVRLNDYRLIEELRSAHGEADRLRAAGVSDHGLFKQVLQQRLRQLGEEAADHFRHVLPIALQQSQHVVVLTHVPPFREACLYQGQISDDNWLPHFTCKAVGEVLVRFMDENPSRSITVLCGHTHTAAFAKVLDNLEVCTGAAEYGAPGVQRTLVVE